jgi:hypothetical protein
MAVNGMGGSPDMELPSDDELMDTGDSMGEAPASASELDVG